MTRFGADVMAVAAILGGAGAAFGATALLADARSGAGAHQDPVLSVGVQEPARVWMAHREAELARARAYQLRDLAQERAAEARARAERARERAAEARERALEARERAMERGARVGIARVRIRHAPGQSPLETDVDTDFDFDFNHDFDFDFDHEVDLDDDIAVDFDDDIAVDFDYDYETGELRLDLSGLEALGALESLEHLQGLERLEALEGLESLERLESLETLELQDRLREEIRRIDEQLSRLDRPRGGR